MSNFEANIGFFAKVVLGIMLLKGGATSNKEFKNSHKHFAMNKGKKIVHVHIYTHTYMKWLDPMHTGTSQTHMPLIKKSEKKVKASVFHCTPTPNITSPQADEISHKNRQHLSLENSLPSNYSPTRQNCPSKSRPGLG